MNKFTFILGGARSGKSSHALKLAERSGKPVTFMATAQAFDDEMSARIQKHKQERPVTWQTLEIPENLFLHVNEIHNEVVILDCITLLVSNLLMKFSDQEQVDETGFMKAVEKEIEELMKVVRAGKKQWVVVSNEVGLGLVPPYPQGRAYRDGLGWANQRLAREADEVILMTAGIPVPIHPYRER